MQSSTEHFHGGKRSDDAAQNLNERLSRPSAPEKPSLLFCHGLTSFAPAPIILFLERLDHHIVSIPSGSTFKGGAQKIRFAIPEHRGMGNHHANWWHHILSGALALASGHGKQALGHFQESMLSLVPEQHARLLAHTHHGLAHAHLTCAQNSHGAKQSEHLAHATHFAGQASLLDSSNGIFKVTLMLALIHSGRHQEAHRVFTSISHSLSAGEHQELDHAIEHDTHLHWATHFLSSIGVDETKRASIHHP
jgi:hypothetical protein